MRRLDMATSYPNPTNQNDLMPAMYEPYSNMVYQNYPSSGPYSDPIADSSRAQHSLIELPISASMLSQEAPACGSDVADSHAWGGRKHVIDPHVDGRIMSFPASNIHGLSLSLGRHHPLHSLHYRASDSDISYLGSHQSSARNNLYSRERNIYYESTSSVPFTKSKYLKAAQELLEEVVNVQTALKQKREKTHSSTALGENDLNLKSNMMHQNSGTSAAERQDKLTKLLYMLDEVDQRYKQYYKEMQAVVSSFDQVAGLGAAQPYTAVALQTISRHFRSLRDAIDGQIRAINMGQGEFERHGHADLADGGIHRLRFIDQKLRPERNLQHFGMVPQHSWRPQRGLPETSVSILRAWLFEHFLHPYPKDSDKLFLARQTGLTRNQVSNWFINARVRLWKPMVEEMYKEEFAGGGSNNCDRDSNSDGGGDGGDGVGSGGGGSCGKSPSLNSPVEGPPLDERGASPEESALLMLRQALIRADSSGGVSLSLGLHQGNRRRSATNGGQKLPAAPERVSGVAACDGSGLGPSLDYDCLHLVERQQRIGSSQLLHDFVV